MSSLALQSPNGNITTLEQTVKPIRDRLRQARDYRRLYLEPTWQLNLAFASGKHWLGWHDKTRTLRTVQELDPRYRRTELITADVITEYRTTALGELGSDNDRPELLLRHDDVASEDYAKQANDAVAYGWDYEWDSDSALAQIDRFMIDLGTAAIRCRYDNSSGQVLHDNVPHYQGMPVLDPGMATQLMGGGPNPDVQMLPLHAGKTCWEPLSAFNILSPPGVDHEDKFPWEAIIRPAYLPDVRDRYGDTAADLKEDTDISTALGISTSSPTLSPAVYGVTDARMNRLRDHIWVFDYYERPGKRYPKGRLFTLGGNDMKLLDYQETLPYQAPDGDWRSGVSYFHWWRVTGRFYSRALMDVLRDAQRGVNKRRTQINAIIDAGMPYVIVEEGSKAKRRQGLVNEIIEIGVGEKAPVPVQGMAPGAWMQADIESLREDLVHASGINGPRRGENPQNVTTYSQLSLINELDSSKREPIYLERKRAIDRLVEDSLWDVRNYWGPQKQLALAGEDGQLRASTFDATKLPTYFILRRVAGSAKPRSAAAELQKITDIWNAAALSTAVQQNPSAWVDWYKQSLETGQALDLPAEQVEDPAEKAEYENHYMRQGTPMPIAYYDVHALHLPRHRKAQDEAMFTQNMQLWQIIENHCQLHMNAAAAQAQAQMQMAQPATPGSPPGQPPLQPQPGGGSPPRATGAPSPPKPTALPPHA